MFKYIPAVTILTIFLSGGANAAETIKGHACYHYSDNESINDARDIALSMAKREALESYSVFVESTSTVENYVLKNDLIASLTAAVLKNLKVISKSEDTKNRKVCRTIQAKIEPLDVKSQIETKIKVYKRKKANFPSGLPENDSIKVLKTEFDKEGYSKHNGYLVPTVFCKKGIYEGKIMIIWYDKDGIPDNSINTTFRCNFAGEIIKIRHRLYLPPPSMTYEYKLLN